MSDATCYASGRGHSWRFWGDDPYVECVHCGQIRDALTDRVMRQGDA